MSGVAGSDLRRDRRRAAGAVAVMGLLSLAAPARAQESIEDMTFFGWALSNVRLGVRVAPDYMGSDDYRLLPSGSLNLYRRGTDPGFGAPDDGVSIGLVGDRTLSAGFSGRWRSGRDNDHDLRGFDKVDGTVEAGAFVASWPADWLRLRAEVRHGFGGHDSWVADFKADAVALRGPWSVSIGPRLSWADDDFTRTYFSVGPAEAARSPYGVMAYAPDGAAVSAGALASAEYRFARRWSVTGSIDYRRILGDAADSPIVVDLGSRDQFNTSVSVRYWFGR